MLARFLRWWFGELAAMVPARLRARRAAGQWLVVDLRGDRVRAWLDGPRARELLDVADPRAQASQDALRDAAATLDPRRVRVRVQLPGQMVLTRAVDLPLAAHENLREVLGFEMSRVTPFRDADVCFDYCVLARDPAAQRLRVSMIVAPRTALAPVFAALRDWDLGPTGEGHPPRRGAEPAPQASLTFQGAAFRARPYAAANAVLGGAAVALAALALWLPVQAQREYRAALDRQLEQARSAAQAVAVLREQLAAEHEARALITGARAGQPGVVELLEVLTRALPDGSHLFRLEVARGEVNLHGSSDAASALIAILEDTPYLRAVRFASPVTRDGATARERFHIVASVHDELAALAEAS